MVVNVIAVNVAERPLQTQRIPFLYRTRKGNEWITFVECMFKGYSLRKSAEIVGVTWVTLFYWRHKLLNALKTNGL